MFRLSRRCPVPRADAQRNIDAILNAAKEEFTAHGVGAHVRTIAARAGVGTGTLYRHFPRRSDLIAAVFRREVEGCAAAADSLAESHEPGEALDLWVQRYTAFVATKHGLATALHSGEPGYAGLREYFEETVGPKLRMLLDNAERAGLIRAGVSEMDLIGAIANLCVPPPGTKDSSRARRMVDLLLDGLRYRTTTPQT